MADMLAEAADYVADAMAASLSQTITYRRGALSVEIPASIGNTDWEIDRGDGMQEIWTSRDFIVKAAALILDGATVTPARGDTVEQTIGAATVTYKLVSPGDEPIWRYADRYQKQIRIHTKEDTET